MSYWRLKFHDGPWDGHMVEIDRDPWMIDLCVPARGKVKHKPHDYEMWRYEPGIVDGEVVHMMGLHKWGQYASRYR